MEKQLKDFISLFVLTPYVQILGFDIENSNITQTLNNIARDYQAQISLLNNNPQIKTKLKRSSCDYIISCTTNYDIQSYRQIFNMLNLTLRDQGYMIFLTQKDLDHSFLYQLLEEFDYGAISSVDIFEQYDLIIGKKLHMWGMD